MGNIFKFGKRGLILKIVICILLIGIIVFSLTALYLRSENDTGVLCLFSWVGWDNDYEYPGLDAFLLTEDDEIIYGELNDDAVDIFNIKPSDKQISKNDFIENLKFYKEEQLSSDKAKKLKNKIDDIMSNDSILFQGSSDVLFFSKNQYSCFPIVCPQPIESDEEYNSNVNINEFFEILNDCVSIDVKNPHNPKNSTKSKETWNEENIEKIYS